MQEVREVLADYAPDAIVEEVLELVVDAAGETAKEGL
jgi:hypothetical protein